jgi:hypothetical protein
MSLVKILIDTSNSIDIVRHTNPAYSIHKTVTILEGIAMGVKTDTVNLSIGATKATADIGFMGGTGIGADELVTINGVAFTAKASGASGLYQYNVDPLNIKVGVDNLVTQINAATSTKIVDVVTATASGATGLAWVRLTACDPGNVGNCLTVTSNASGVTGLATFVGASATTANSASK